MQRKRSYNDEFELPIPKRIKQNGCAIILMGLPGSGKSFLSPKIEDKINNILDNDYKYINLNPDNVSSYGKYNSIKALSHKCRIINKKLSEIFKSQNNESFIYDGTGSNKSVYNFIIKNCIRLEYKIYLVYIKSELDLALERNRTRDRHVNTDFIINYSSRIEENFQYYIKQNIKYLIIDNNCDSNGGLKIINSRL